MRPSCNVNYEFSYVWRRWKLTSWSSWKATQNEHCRKRSLRESVFVILLFMFLVCVCIYVETGDTTNLEHVPEEEVIRVLADYLSEMTLKDVDPFGLQLSEWKILEGYHLARKRFSKPKVYKSRPGFSILLSREWRYTETNKRPTESVFTTK